MSQWYWHLQVCGDSGSVHMKTRSVQSLWAGVLALWVLLLAMPNSVDAGHTGSEWYLISNSGKLIRKLEWKERDGVDVEAAQAYRLEGGRLIAKGFMKDAPNWSFRSPVQTQIKGALIFSDTEVLAILADGILQGYDKRTGRDRYSTGIGSFSLPREYFVGFSWGVPANGESGRFLYLTRENTELVKHESGWMERTAVEPPTLAKIDLRTGRRLWERTLGTNIVVGDVSPGFVSAIPHSACFDPASGHAITNLGEIADVVYSGTTLFCLSGQQPATLTAVESKTGNVLWQLQQLAGVRKLVKPYTDERLLCASESRVVVIDTAKRRIQSEFPLPAALNAGIIQANGVIFAGSYGSVRAVNPKTGITRWEYAAKTGFASVFESAKDEILVVETGPYVAQRVTTFELLALGKGNGKPKWRWRVPDGPWGDSVGVTVRPCPAGLAVCRSWLVGE